MDKRELYRMKQRPRRRTLKRQIFLAVPVKRIARYRMAQFLCMNAYLMHAPSLNIKANKRKRTVSSQRLIPRKCAARQAPYHRLYNAFPRPRRSMTDCKIRFLNFLMRFKLLAQKKISASSLCKNNYS